jgi:hypothetical protein
MPRLLRLTSSLIAAAVFGQIVAQLGWIDQLFIPLVVLGPVITGALAAAGPIAYPWIAMVWCSAGIGMAWSDWVVNHEDAVFHLTLAILMPLLAGIGYGMVRLAASSRRRPA